MIEQKPTIQSEISELMSLVEVLSPDEQKELAKLVTKGIPPWLPMKGPQLEAWYSKADILLFGGSGGGAKQINVNTLVPTPGGWIRMGEIRDGDIIFSEKGEPIRVLKAHPITVPKVAYRLKFDDRSEIDACSEHRWLTFDEKELRTLTTRTSDWQQKRREKRKSRRQPHTSELKYQTLLAHNAQIAANKKHLPLSSGSIRTTQEIFETLKVYHASGSVTNHAIPVSHALILPERKLPIYPYLLGLWLGDGSAYKGEITTIDHDILDAFRNAGFQITHRDRNTYGIGNRFITLLKSLGLANGKKFIPTIYLRASISQRLDLLQGLMDSDGSASKEDGGTDFSNTRYELIEGIHDLIVSLGWKAFITSRRAKLYGKDCGPAWKVTFRPSDYVFKLSRKRNLQRLARRQTNRFRYIIECERIKPTPMRCLTVDNQTGLYLVGRSMIPTHNTDFIIGLALISHKKSLIVRREATQVEGMIDRIAEVLKTKDGFNAQKLVWNISRLQKIEFGGCKDPGDELRWMGRPHDFLAFDQVETILENQFRFLITWNRTNRKDQRCRVVATANPPTTSDGRWIIDYWGAWLNDKHPNPAKPGELRWYTTIKGKDVELLTGDPIKDEAGNLVTPRSRTFIPASVYDNPFLMATGYDSVLAGLPEPLRSQMLHGDFKAGMEDSQWQVIPTAWVDAAMARWTEFSYRQSPMTSMGVDVARGGRDKTIIATRYGNWYAQLISFPGTETPDGSTTAGLVVSVRRDGAPVHVDVIGVGGSVVDHLRSNDIQVVGINGAEAADQGATDKATMRLSFRNMRAQLWWRFREALDPKYGASPPIALPNDSELRADLCTPLWKLTPSGIQIESKEEIVKRIGRSPDKGDAVVYCSVETTRQSARDYDFRKHLRRGTWRSA